MSSRDEITGRPKGHRPGAARTGSGGGSGGDVAAFIRAIEPVARELLDPLLGDPVEYRNGKHELRWGSRGSMSVDLDKGTWFDNEESRGGGVVDLVQVYTDLDKAGAVAWLRERGHLTPTQSKSDRSREVAAYRYPDAAGELLFEVVRFEPKAFRPRRPDGQGGVAWNLDGVQRVLYRLPEVLAAVAAGKPVYVVEGEKSADALTRLGLTATCSPGGANKWRAEYNHALDGADIVILPDNDEPGQKHADAVKKTLAGVAKRIRVLSLPGLAPKGDVFDWIADSGNLEALHALLERMPEAEAEEAPFKLLWLDDIKPVLDAKDFVQGVLMEKSSVVIYGESSAGKTFWTNDLALHVAAGLPWNGRRVEQGGVVYCVLEGGDGFRNRVAIWRKRQIENGADPNVKLPFAAVDRSLNMLNPDADILDLIATVNIAAKQMGTPVKLIVIDTLSRALAGGNENDSQDMGALVQNMDKVRAATGACVLFVHHSGKDQAKGARGHSLLRAALDTEIEVKVDHDTGVRTATVEKQRDMAKGAAFAFALETVEVGTNRHGEAVTTCLVKAGDGPLPKARAKAKPLSPKADSLLLEIGNLMARGDGQMDTPEPGMREVMTVPRNILNDYLVQQGWLETIVRVSKQNTETQVIPATERNKLWERLSELKGHGIIGFTKDHVWLAERPL